MNASRSIESPTSPLRNARKDFTRRTICEAAKEVFFELGYDSATINDISTAAGTRPSTLYTHFRNKDEILKAIADSYIVEFKEVIARLKGPEPTRDEISQWLQELSEFIRSRRVPTVLLLKAGIGADDSDVIREFGLQLTQAFANSLPRFKQALKPKADPMKFAWAATVIRNVAQSVSTYVETDGKKPSGELMAVAGELFYRFTQGEFTS